MLEFEFIVNPKSGHYRAGRMWEQFHSQHAEIVPERVHWTERRGHAEEIARRLRQQGATRMVAVGGDGLLNEVVNGLFDPEDIDPVAGAQTNPPILLGHFPAGSGCDFARQLGLSRDPATWGQLLMSGRQVPIDVGYAQWGPLETPVGHRFFVTVAMAGIAGEIAATVDRVGKPLGGLLSYLLVSLRHLLTARSNLIELSIDDQEPESRSYHLIALANAATTAGMQIAPRADPTDGWFDLLLVGDLSRWRLLTRFPRIYQGKLDGVPGVEQRRVRSLRADAGAAKVLMNIDGEPLGELPVRIEMLPSALTMLAPAD
ncbi:MAG: diacylglycerol kinase family protein [Planctomycetota bacterium]|nr:diacylglycerol kinase family protein [Planctomycetota bacterium]